MQDHSYLLSIIIPVYNMEKYLERCLDSVIRNRIPGTQIILIDDGSKDESPAICDRYAQQFPDIAVIHQENGGLSAARNTGIAAAQGEYIFFLDSDDAIQDGFLMKFLDYINEHSDKPDMIMFDFVYVHHTTGDEKVVPFPLGADKLHNITGLQALKMLHDADPYFEWYCVRYIYRSAFIEANKLQFINGVYFEDVPWTSRALTLAKLVDYLPAAGYRYTVFRMGSIVNRWALKKIKDKLIISASACRFDFEHIKDEVLLDKLLSNHAEFYVGAFRNFCECVPEGYSYLKEYVWLAKYSKTRFGKFVYLSTKIFGFRIGSWLSKRMFRIMGLDK